MKLVSIQVEIKYSEKRIVFISFEDSKATIRDLWERKDVGTATGKYSSNVSDCIAL